MELRKLKRKNISRPAKEPYFPSFTGEKCTAAYTGLSCYVQPTPEVLNFINMGLYGTGTLSRSEPCWDKPSELPEIILEQQFLNRNKIERNDSNDHSTIIYSDSSELVHKTVSSFLRRSRTGDYAPLANNESQATASVSSKNRGLSAFLNYSEDDESMSVQCDALREMVHEVLASNTKKPRNPIPATVIVAGVDGPREVKAPPRPKERLVFDLQETFFLSAALGVLQVIDSAGNPMSHSEMWTTFQKTDSRFISKYIAYHWYRSKGWIVRSGLKQGGDFVLYQQEPQYCHSSCVVHVRDGSARLEWKDLAMLQRLVETFRKDVLVCCVLRDSDTSDVSLDFTNVRNCRVVDIMWRRWAPHQQRTPN